MIIITDKQSQEDKEITWWDVVTNPQKIWNRFMKFIDEIDPIKWLIYVFILLIGIYVLINLAIYMITQLFKRLVCCKRK